MLSKRLEIELDMQTVELVRDARATLVGLAEHDLIHKWIRRTRAKLPVATANSSSRPSRWCEAYLWSHLRGNAWCAQGLFGECHS
jgi:hypothetical protein